MWAAYYLVVLVLLVGVIFVFIRWKRQHYPYGFSHCCAGIPYVGLQNYARDQGGWFPHGQATPEASLSLLLKSGIAQSDIMRGKTVPPAVVDAAFARDGVLGPASCGWQYVEGLREDDDPEIALVWDKVGGLDHNGGYSPTTAHEVQFLNGSSRCISTNAWPGFVANQKQLLTEARAKRGPDDPPIRWSDEKDLGPNVSPPRLIAPISTPKTQTNVPTSKP